MESSCVHNDQSYRIVYQNKKEWKKQMGKIKHAAAAILLAGAMLLTGCAKSEFLVSENTEKRMTISAVNAGKDAFFSVDSLEVEEGEQVVITANLTKGSIQVSIVAEPEEQSADAVPERNGDAVITANLKSTDSVSGTVAAGTYAMEAVCLEKATGTVVIEVKPA